MTNETQQLFLLEVNKLVRDAFDFTKYFIEKLNILVDKKPPSVFAKSPFFDLISSDPHTRGKAGERIVEYLAKDLGFPVAKSKQGDRKINGVDVEIKFARQKEDGGFLVNQIRLQHYSYVVLVVVRPSSVHLFTIPKEEILQHCTGQHGGTGAKETFIYSAKDFDELRLDFREREGLTVFESSLSDSSRTSMAHQLYDAGYGSGGVY